ncbi:unnamed protein product [Closterium sp. NIES-53]
MPVRELNSVTKLGTPGVNQATEAALVPLTKLPGRRGLTGTRLLLALATTKASTLRGCTSTSTTAAATSTTAAAASTTAAATSTTSTAATEAPTRGTTPTSTAIPSASSTATAAAPAIPSTTLAPLALAVAMPPTGTTRSPDLLSANEVDSSSKSNRGEKGDRGTPLKERELSGKGIAVAGITSAEVSSEVGDCGKGGKVREKVWQHEAAEGNSGRGGVACNYSVVQRLSSLVLAKMRSLSRRQVTTNSKTSNSITSGPLRANRTASSGSRSSKDTRRVIEMGYPIPRVTLKKELQVINPHVKVNCTPLSIKGENSRAGHSSSRSSSSSSSRGSSRSSSSSSSRAVAVVAAGAGGIGDTRAGGAGVTVGAGGTAAADPGGARTRGTGAAVTGGVGGSGAGDPTEPVVAGAGGTGAKGTGAGDAGAGGAGAGDTRAGGAGAGRAGAGSTGAGGDGAGGVGAVDRGAGGAGTEGAGGTGARGTMRPRPYFVPLLQQSQPPLQPASPLPAPSPHTEQSGGLTERHEPASRLVSPVRTARCVPRSCPPPVPGTHAMALRPSSVPLRVLLPPPPKSCLPAIPDPESDLLRAASPTISRLLAIVVTGPSFDSTSASALIAELLDFAAACRLYYATALVAETESACPPSVGGECALGTDVLEDRQEDFECLAAAVPRFASMLLAPEGDLDAPEISTPRSYTEAIMGPYSSQWQVVMDAEMASWKSTSTYVDAGVDYFQTLSPTPKMTTLWVLLQVAAQRDFELHSLEFSTAFLQGSLHEEIWLRRPPGFTGSFPAGIQWSLRRPVYGLRQVPREWHDTLRTTLAALGFAPSTADPSLFLRTDTSLPPFYVLVYVADLVFATADTEALTLVKSELQKRHTCNNLGELRIYLGLQITRERARRTITLTQSHMAHQVLQRFGFQFSSPQPTPLSTGHLLSAPPSDESVELSGPYLELVGCLMYLMTCTRPDLAYPLSLLACYVAPGRHQKVHWDAAKRVLRYLCSTLGMGLVLGGRSPVVFTGHADASWVDDLATQRSSQGYTFSLDSGSVSWQSTHSSSVFSSSCEAEIYAGAMAAQELR